VARWLAGGALVALLGASVAVAGTAVLHDAATRGALMSGAR